MIQICTDEVEDHEISGEDFSEQISAIGSDDDNNDNSLQSDDDDSWEDKILEAINEDIMESPLNDKGVKFENKDFGDNEEYFEVERNLYELDSESENLKVPEVPQEQLIKWFPHFKHDKKLVMSKLFQPRHSWLKCHMEDLKKRKSKHSKEDAMSNEVMRSPAPHEIEEDTTKYSVIADEEIKGVHRVNRHGPCKIWYDKLDVPNDADSFNYSWLPGPTKEDIDLIDKAVEELVESFHRDFQKLKKRKHDDSGLQSCKRLKIISEKFNMGSIMFDPLNQKHEVLQELMNDLVDKNFHQTPEGRQLIKEIRLNHEVTFTEDSIPYYANSQPPHKTVNEQFGDKYSCYDNVEVGKGSWIDSIIWDNEDLENFGEPRVMNVDGMMFSYLKDNLEVEDCDADDDEEEDDDDHVKHKSHGTNTISFLIDDEYYPLEAIATTPDELSHPKFVRDMNFSIFPPFFSYNPDLHIYHRPKLKVNCGEGEGETHRAQRVFPLKNMIESRRANSQGAGEREIEKISDLTGRHGDIVLMEFAEDFPLLMNQLGMANKICNYYLEDNKSKPPNAKFGVNVGVNKGQRSFLGDLKPDQCLSAFENNMYRAPIFEHIMKTDFLIIHTGQCFFIRTVDALFAVGQQTPLIEVPKPYSKIAQNIVKDYILLYMCRLFWRCRGPIKYVKTEDMKRAFPHQSDLYIRNKLAMWSTFSRNDCKWIVKEDLILPEEQNLPITLTPELYCAFKSMRNAELRLMAEGHYIQKKEDDGRGDNDNSEEDEKLSQRLDTFETAPWSTTNAYMSAMSGKCLLDACPDNDPTDCGIGFSYVKVPCKPISNKDSEKNQKQRLHNTAFDYRSNTIQDLRKILTSKLKVPEHEIKFTNRFDLVKMVQDICNERAKNGDTFCQNYARIGPSVTRDHKDKYLKRCQDAFEQQNRFLARYESSDDEELEREILNYAENDDDFEFKEDVQQPPKMIRKLKITRTVLNKRGMPEDKQEIITDQLLIDLYINKMQDKVNMKQVKEHAPVTDLPKLKNRQQPKKRKIELTDEEIRQKIELRKEKKRASDRKKYHEKKMMKLESGQGIAKLNDSNIYRKHPPSMAPFKDSSNQSQL